MRLREGDVDGGPMYTGKSHRACPDCGLPYGATKPRLHSPCNRYGVEALGRRVQLVWPPTQEYFSAVVRRYDAGTGMHEVYYDGHEIEWLNLGAERRHARWIDAEPPSHERPAANMSTGRKAKAPKLDEDKSQLAEGNTDELWLVRIYRDAVHEGRCLGALLVRQEPPRWRTGTRPCSPAPPMCCGPDAAGGPLRGCLQAQEGH